MCTSLIGSVVILQCHVICFTWNGHRSNFASVLSAHYVSNFKSLALQDLIFWMCSVVWYFHAVTNPLNLLRHLVKPFITQASDLQLNQQKQWKYDSEPQFGSVLPYRNLGMVLGTTSRFDWAWGWHSVRERSGCKGFIKNDSTFILVIFFICLNWDCFFLQSRTSWRTVGMLYSYRPDPHNTYCTTRSFSCSFFELTY